MAREGALVRSEGGLSPRWWMRGDRVQDTDSSENKFAQVEFLGQDIKLWGEPFGVGGGVTTENGSGGRGAGVGDDADVGFRHAGVEVAVGFFPTLFH